MKAKFSNQVIPEPTFGSDVDSVSYFIISLLKKFLDERGNDFSLRFTVEIRITRDISNGWFNIRTAINKNLEKLANKLHYEFLGTVIKNVAGYFFLKISLQEKSLLKKVMGLINEQKPLINTGENWEEMAGTYSLLSERIRSTINQHQNADQVDSDSLVTALIEVFDDYHSELLRVDKIRHEAARLELERRVMLKRKSSVEKTKQGTTNKSSHRQALRLLSPEEQLERIRAQDRERQAKRYARLRSIKRTPSSPS